MLSPQHRYIGHQRGIWKIMGKAIFFEKGSLLIYVPVMQYRPLKLGKNWRFSNTCQLFFLQNFLKYSFTTTLYLLDFIWFWPIFGLFYYAKFPSYKRVRWGRLAGPSHILASSSSNISAPTLQTNEHLKK